jgi:hypothetical protein
MFTNSAQGSDVALAALVSPFVAVSFPADLQPQENAPTVDRIKRVLVHARDTVRMEFMNVL